MHAELHVEEDAWMDGWIDVFKIKIGVDEYLDF